VKITLTEKIRLLRDIARALCELHSIGIVHGDIKPGNILLSTDHPPQIRLADFGFTIVQENSLMESNLKETTLFRGTPIYSAPEMLFNPYREDLTTAIAETSRKTDMYAFSILCWEVLSGMTPYSEIKSIFELGARLHQGYRPDINWLPQMCPDPVIAMMRACWSGDRQERKTACECYEILEFQHHRLAITEGSGLSPPSEYFTRTRSQRFEGTGFGGVSEEPSIESYHGRNVQSLS
jgi:serine/threonine protein kinase